MRRPQVTITILILALNLTPVLAQGWGPRVRNDLALNDIQLSDPAILADKSRPKPASSA